MAVTRGYVRTYVRVCTCDESHSAVNGNDFGPAGLTTISRNERHKGRALLTFARFARIAIRQRRVLLRPRAALLRRGVFVSGSMAAAAVWRKKIARVENARRVTAQ